MARGQQWLLKVYNPDNTLVLEKVYKTKNEIAKLLGMRQAADLVTYTRSYGNDPAKGRRLMVQRFACHFTIEKAVPEISDKLKQLIGDRLNLPVQKKAAAAPVKRPRKPKQDNASPKAVKKPKVDKKSD